MSLRLPAATLSVAVALLAQIQQTPPVFRGGVDLVTVDVSVVDKAGSPVPGLTPADFTVVAGQRPRRIVSVDYIAAKGRPATTTLEETTATPAPSTNVTPLVGRSFLFVVDVDQIGSGEGRVVLKSIGDYLDRLSPDDRVGIVSVPTGTPRVDLTTNRRLVRNAAALIVGASLRNRGLGMTVGEAAAIERLDEQVMNEYRVRIKRLPCNEVGCIKEHLPEAIKIMDAERRHTVTLFDTLRALATAMAPIDGPKTIVLVSNGVINDMQTLRDTERFATAAANARVTLHALNLQGSLADVSSRSNLIGPHRLDHGELLDGMSTLAIAGRGDVFLVSGTPTAALARIDAEMSGYYLLSFERELSDRDGERTRIDVRVTRPDVFVRARTDFTPEKPGAATASSAPALPKDLKAAIGEALRFPVSIPGLGIDLDTYTLPAPPGAEPRTILAASLGVAPGKTVVAVGYEVTDEAGKAMADDMATTAVSTVPLPGDKQLYTSAFALPPGLYRVKFAAIDATGRRGSVEHGFEVRTGRAGALQLGDVFIGDVTTPAGFVPAPSLAAGATSLPVRVDLVGDTPAALEGAALTLELLRPGTAPFANIKLSTVDTNDPRRRVATAMLAISSLAPGEYVVSARLRAADGTEATTSRLFVKR